MDVFAGQTGVLGEDGVLGPGVGKQLDDELDGERVPFTTGFPSRMSGFSSTRSSQPMRLVLPRGSRSVPPVPPR